MKSTKAIVGRGVARRNAILGITVALCFGMTGCGNMDVPSSESRSDSEKRKVVDPDKARTKTRKVSSNLLDLSGLKGKVTPAGPLAMTSGQRPGNYYMRHSWSVWGVTEVQLKKAMENLHRALPENGWKIEKYERANSKAQQLQLEAFHAEDKFYAQVELLFRDHENTVGPSEDILSFTVSSPTFTAPEGEEID